MYINRNLCIILSLLLPLEKLHKFSLGRHRCRSAGVANLPGYSEIEGVRYRTCSPPIIGSQLFQGLLDGVGRDEYVVVAPIYGDSLFTLMELQLPMTLIFRHQSNALQSSPLLSAQQQPIWCDGCFSVSRADEHVCSQILACSLYALVCKRMTRFSTLTVLSSSVHILVVFSLMRYHM